MYEESDELDEDYDEMIEKQIRARARLFLTITILFYFDLVGGIYPGKT